MGFVAYGFRQHVKNLSTLINLMTLMVHKDCIWGGPFATLGIHTTALLRCLVLLQSHSKHDEELRPAAVPRYLHLALVPPCMLCAASNHHFRS